MTLAIMNIGKHWDIYKKLCIKVCQLYIQTPKVNILCGQ